MRCVWVIMVEMNPVNFPQSLSPSLTALVRLSLLSVVLVDVKIQAGMHLHTYAHAHTHQSTS